MWVDELDRDEIHLKEFRPYPRRFQSFLIDRQFQQEQRQLQMEGVLKRLSIEEIFKIKKLRSSRLFYSILILASGIIISISYGFQDNSFSTGVFIVSPSFFYIPMIIITIFIGISIYINQKWIIDELLDTSEKIKEKSKKRTPKIFHVLDEPTVIELYNQLTEPEPTEIEKTIRKEDKHSVSGTVSILKGELGENTIQETKQKFLGQIALANKYNTIEEKLDLNEEIIHNLENFKPDNRKISHMKLFFEDFKKRFGVDIEGREKYIKEIIIALAKEKLNQISQAAGYILVKGLFHITNITETNIVLCYSHPINNYIDRKIQFSITVDKSFLRKRGIHAFQQDKDASMTCMGIINRWESKEETLYISSIAIY